MKKSLPWKFSAGVYFTVPSALMTTVPFEGPPTGPTLSSALVLSTSVSLSVTSMSTALSSLVVAASSVAIGGSFTALTVTLTVAAALVSVPSDTV